MSLSNSSREQQERKHEEEQARQKDFAKHLALVNKLLHIKTSLIRSKTIKYEDLTHALNKLPALNTDPIINLGRSTEKTKSIPSQHGYNLFYFIFKGKNFSAEQKITLLNTLINKGYEKFRAIIFNTPDYIDTMYNHEWHAFILQHYYALLSQYDYPVIVLKHEKLLCNQLISRPELDNNGKLLQIMYSAYSRSLINCENFLEFIYRLVNIQPANKVESTYNMVTAKIADWPLLKKHLPDIKKMVKNRFLELEFSEKKHKNSDIDSKRARFLKEHRSGFFGSTKSWEIHEKLQKNNPKILAEARLMLNEEQNKLEKSLRKA